MFDGPNFSGGPVINLTRLLPELKKRGHDINVLCFFRGTEHPNADLIAKQGVNCMFKSIELQSNLVVPWILKKCKKLNPDIFIPDVSTQGLLAGKWIKSFGVPVINTMRGNDDLNWGKAVFFSRKSKWQTSAIVFVNDYLKNELNSRVKTELEQVVIPSGVNTSIFKSNQNKSKIGFVYSGRLTNRIKNVNEIILAFINIAKEYSHTYFNIIGSGEESENILNLIKKHKLESIINIVSPLKGDKYKEFLAQHNFILLMSDSEGTPGAIMDGMSCGLIPLVNYYVGIERLVINNKTGIIFDKENNQLIDVLKDVIHDVEFKELLSDNAVEHIKKYFSLDYCVNQWEYLFTKLEVRKKRKFVTPKRVRLPGRNKLLIEHIPKDTCFNKIKSLVSKVNNKVLKIITELYEGVVLG